MNNLFYERDNINLIIGAGDGYRILNNDKNKLISEIEFENLHLKYNTFICNPYENIYYDLNKTFLSNLYDENMNKRDYQLQILDLNNESKLNCLYNILKNKVNLIEIQNSTWYFMNNPNIFDILINVLKKNGIFKYPFKINNSILSFDLIMFKKILNDNLIKITKNKIIYDEKRDLYLRIIGSNCIFPNSTLLFNIKLMGKKEKYFELIQKGIISNNLMYYLNNNYRLLKIEKKDKIIFSDIFDDFLTDINTDFNNIFMKNSKNLDNISENDILDSFLNITNLYIFFSMLYIKNFEHTILIDIENKDCFQKTIVIQHI